MVTYSVTKVIPTCSPVIGQFFDTMIVDSTDISNTSNTKLPCPKQNNRTDDALATITTTKKSEFVYKT